MKSRLPASHRVVSPRALRVEPLESRICPSALNVAMGSTATTLINAGDTGTAGSSLVLSVSAGEALVFVTDLNNDGVYEAGELTGIALAANSNVHALDVVNGDIVTNLNADGTLITGASAHDGTALLASNIAGLTLDGGVHKILAGGSITNVTAANAMEIRNGTAAGLQSFNFNAASSPPSLLAFMPADAAKGGDMTQDRKSVV